MNEDNRYRLKDYMLNRPPLTPERIKELADLTCYVGNLTEEELKSPVVLRSEYESLRQEFIETMQYLANHSQMTENLKDYCNKTLVLLEE